VASFFVQIGTTAHLSPALAGTMLSVASVLAIAVRAVAGGWGWTGLLLTAVLGAPAVRRGTRVSDPAAGPPSPRSGSGAVGPEAVRR
jgi:hypothetical protein